MPKRHFTKTQKTTNFNFVEMDRTGFLEKNCNGLMTGNYLKNVIFQCERTFIWEYTDKI